MFAYIYGKLLWRNEITECEFLKYRKKKKDLADSKSPNIIGKLLRGSTKSQKSTFGLVIGIYIHITLKDFFDGKVTKNKSPRGIQSASACMCCLGAFLPCYMSSNHLFNDLPVLRVVCLSWSPVHYFWCPSVLVLPSYVGKMDEFYLCDLSTI